MVLRVFVHFINILSTSENCALVLPCRIAAVRVRTFAFSHAHLSDSLGFSVFLQISWFQPLADVLYLHDSQGT